MKGFSTRLKTNNKQVTRFQQHAGTARHAWNWGLALCIDMIYTHEKTPTGIDLHKLLVKNVKPENKWYYESSKCSPQQALRDLHEAFQKFWTKHKINKTLPLKKRYLKKFIKQKQRGDIKELWIEHEKGFPRFKKKGVNDSFYLEGNFDVIGNKIKVPKIGWLQTYEQLPENADIKNVVISRVADEWFISFVTDRKCEFEKTVSDSDIGVDLGIKMLATVSNGDNFQSPKAYKKHKNKLRRLQKSLSRKYEAHKKLESERETKLPYGSNYKKAKSKLAKLHQRVANIRLDNTHKLTTNLTKNHRRISIEGLNVSGMMKNHNLASAIADGGFFEFKRQLDYKCKWRGVELVIIDQWFPSSQLCSCCGNRQPMPLKKRVFECEKCSLVIDRDFNAAINIRDYHKKWILIYPPNKLSENTASCAGVKACGDAKVQGNLEKDCSVSVNEAGIRHQTPHIGNVQVCVGS